MKWKTCVTIVAIALVPATVHAGNATVRGVGAERCAIWEKNPEKRRGYMQWVLGFVSAMNYAHWKSVPAQAENIDLVNGVDAEAIQAWMTTFCAQNQLHPIAIAAAVLVRDGLEKDGALQD